MTKQFLKDAFGWGVGLWFIGYVLGFIFFAFVPKEQIGLFVMPIGILITLWVLIKKIKGNFNYFLKIAIIWTLIAIIFDYLFLVKLLNPAGGYYKLDVYVYYLMTLVLPLLVSSYKTRFSK